MIILGIETSCDETSAAVVKDGTKILSNIVASSKKFHIKTGGIVPEIAAREQIKYLIPVINQALSEAKITLYPKPYSLNPGIDALAVTIGPGLIGSLLVGVETAKTLAYLWQKPIVPVNHLIAHLYANWLKSVPKHLSGGVAPAAHLKGGAAPGFPTLGLIASGGHTDLVLMKNHGRFQWLGGTRDDAAGEAFDKIARLLGLPYPGGPAIARLATKRAENYESGIKLPRPLSEEESFDFSFSGLKTAVFREVNRLKTKKQFNKKTIQQLSYEVQEAITDVLVTKTIRAAQKYEVKSIMLGGGVTANERLRGKMESRIRNPHFVRRSRTSRGKQELGISLHIPPPDLSTDNAAVIASSAYFNYKPVPWPKIHANPELYY